jgi:ribosomal-protein-alanine N-acetyltransferase
VLVRTAADEAEVLTVAVRPGHRGRGYGRALMEEALRRLYRERIAACFLEVDEGNVAALALYKRLGFSEVGKRQGYYPSSGDGPGTALVMRLQLR